MCLVADIPQDFYSVFTQALVVQTSDRFWKQHLTAVKGMAREVYFPYIIIFARLLTKYWCFGLHYQVSYLMDGTDNKKRKLYLILEEKLTEYLDASQYVCSSAS